MFRSTVALLLLPVAAVAVLACGRGAPRTPQPVMAAVLADMVVVGTVVEIESDPMCAKSHPDAVEQTPYTVAIVRVDNPLYGAKHLTHVRVGVPMGTLDGPNAQFQKDGKYLFFLQRHSVTSLMLPSYTHAPVDLYKPGSEEVLRRVAIATAAFNDPMKALKADNKEDRVLAASALTMRYRRQPNGGAQSVAVERPAEETKLLFAALAEADWAAPGTPETGNPQSLLYGMGLENDGFQFPKSGNTVVENKAAFVKWIAGAGKDVRLKQFVAKN